MHPEIALAAGMEFDHRQGALLVVLLGAALVIGGCMFYLSRQHMLEQVIQERTQELEQLTAELERCIGKRTCELDQERARLRTILEAMEEGVLYREQSQLKFVNPSLYQMLGYSAEEY
ncbi:MAG: PAS domain-containing protein, partial [Chloroflexi bacterium]|nr:PAS domain-containing protein [Chloroflexota bacterium]